MTNKEFMTGWVLLVAQPWGARYAEKSESAQIQAQEYHRAFNDLPATLWVDACRKCISSHHKWPTINDLRLLTPQRKHRGVETAWAALRASWKSDDVSVVWSDEERLSMRAALAIPGDETAARMAFKEAYGAALAEAEAAGTTPKYSVSFGFKADARADAVRKAKAEGILTPEEAIAFMPRDTMLTRAEEDLLRLIGEGNKLLEKGNLPSE